MKFVVEANRRGVHWSEVAVEEKFLLACDGPLTQREGKLAEGIVDAEELAHASQFRQMVFECVATDPDGHAIIKSMAT